MAYVCEKLDTSTNACLQWVEYVHPLAITKSQMIEIGGPLLAVAAVFIAYAIIAKAVKML